MLMMMKMITLIAPIVLTGYSTRSKSKKKRQSYSNRHNLSWIKVFLSGKRKERNVFALKIDKCAVLYKVTMIGSQ